MTRTLALESLRRRARILPVKFEPVRLDCRSGKCGKCHSCTGANNVPVALQKGGAR
jgi:hypothetical protein